jgi:hypothetical protein
VHSISSISDAFSQKTHHEVKPPPILKAIAANFEIKIFELSPKAQIDVVLTEFKM